MNKADQLARSFEVASILARQNRVEVECEEVALLRRKAAVLDGILHLALDSRVYRVEICVGVDKVDLWEIQILGRYKDAIRFTSYDPLEAIESAMAQQSPRDVGREGKP